jgi:acyl-CoA reductase-like NAD-dependent aldehyde dehydrogenase
MSTERILVHQSILEPFQDALQTAINNVFPSDQPAPVLVASAGVEKNKKLLADVTSKGGSVVHGEPNVSEESKFRMRPVVVSGVTKDMDLYYTESFGPTVSLISVSSDDEAVAIANDTEYGLSAAVFTENLARGLKLAKRIESGAVHINSMTVHDEAALPHGGVKRSGFGRFNGTWGFDEFLQLKTVTFAL